MQPYKIGPDYIDGRLTTRFAGRPCYSVDLWLDGEGAALRHVTATRGDADACVFEGMMGLYDGDNEGETSTAAVALLLDAPVLLVLDGWTASQTLAAVAAGLRDHEPRLRIAGAILNRAGGVSHARAVEGALRRSGIPLLGVLPFDGDVASAERALGLDREDAEARAEAVERVAARLRAELDLDALVPPSVHAAGEPRKAPSRVRIAVAEDEAFWFTYPETLLALQAAGAEAVMFSPLRDTALPPGIAGLWLSGGYPELHAATLAENAAMRSAIRDAMRDGLPTYAECGGMMYLAETLVTEDGAFPMCGAFVGATTIAEPRLTIGYRRAQACTDGPLDVRDAALRGYEFRYASGELAGQRAYRYEDGSTAGVATATACASFLHRHFTVGDPAIARFVAQCTA